MIKSSILYRISLSVCLMLIMMVSTMTTIWADNTDYEAIPVQRLYNPINSAHLLTTDQNEIETLISQHNWQDEGIGFYTPNVETKVKIFRLYNPTTSEHLYTANEDEYNVLQTIGWSGEGVAFYGAVNNYYPLYRLYNSLIYPGVHLWTSNSYENDLLPNLAPVGAWKQEGIAWNAETLNNDISSYSYSSQKLDLPSIANIRQLGGYRMADGRKVKNNMLIRSGALNNLTEDDKVKLTSNYNLKGVVDFRSDTAQEQGNNPDIIPEGVNYYFYPALDSNKIYDDETKQLLYNYVKETGGNDKMGSLVILAQHKGMKQLYSNILNTDMAKKAYRQLFQVLLDNAKSENPGAVLWHCTQGKDRAGIASALVLTALGADDATIRRDYSLTSNAYVNETAQIKQYAQNQGLSEEVTHELLAAVGNAYPENLQSTIDSVGSLKKYLTEEIGLTEDDFKTLQDAYLE